MKSFGKIRYQIVLTLVGHVCILSEDEFRPRRSLVALESLAVNIICLQQIEAGYINT